MAYLKEKNRDVDIDFPLQQVWEAIPKAVAELGWEIVEKNGLAYELTIRTSQSLSSYASTVHIELTALDQKTTHMVVYGETPVTTITSTLEFNQTFDAVEDFISVLAEIMNR
jgi:hypothetical protein